MKGGCELQNYVNAGASSTLGFKETTNKDSNKVTLGLILIPVGHAVTACIVTGVIWMKTPFQKNPRIVPNNHNLPLRAVIYRYRIKPTVELSQQNLFFHK